MIDMSLHPLRLLVKRHMLERSGNYEWTLQGFGMLRAYLSPDVRVHIWDSRFRTANVSLIHDHPWHFESLVLQGSVENVRYFQQNSMSDFQKTHVEGRIFCGPNPKEHGAEEIRNVSLETRSDGYYVGGDGYSMHADELHSSHAMDGTITVCRRVPARKKDPDRALVYWPIGTKWVSAEPRTATPSEVGSIIEKALRIANSL